MVGRGGNPMDGIEGQAVIEAQHLLSIPEVARRIGISRQRVHALIANRQLRSIRLGHYHYIEQVEIDHYLALPQGKPFAPRSTARSDSVDKSK
jgi:excisionase family DNA binding protein